MAPYRILVVDDSAFMRKFISDIVNGDEALTVVGTAKSGREAIEAVKLLRPDAVTMDVEMPEMTGLEALPIVMREAPTPIIMLSSSTHEGTTATIQALELGAFDFVAKPSGPISADVDRVRESLVATLLAAVVDKKEEVVGRLQPKPLPLPKPPAWGPPKPIPPDLKRKPALPAAPSPAVSAPVSLRVQMKTKSASAPFPPASSTTPNKRPNRRVNRIVAIGTSTGGPRALQQVLSQLPESMPAAILIVQHMPPGGFTKSLAQRLNTLCAIQVTEAEDGMELMQGTAYLAPGGLHMTLRKELGSYRLRLTEDPPRSGHRPSVDTLFESLTEFPELDRTVVLMTGMGSDGAKGMKQLFDGGVTRTIAEDQTSCIVYGMPRAAVELGCVAHTIPLDRIAAQMMKEVT